MPIVFNLIVIAMVGFIAYMWSQEGLFSAFIHFICTVIAGAVAFAVWEPLAYIMLGVREDIAWSVSLGIPFLATLGLLRVIMDKAIPHNMKFPAVANLVGGGAFGLGSGLIAVGILIICMGFLRLPSDFLGYKPITYDAQGNLQRTGGLWVPADKLTAKLYERLSIAGLATSTPMALVAPDVNEQAALMRITFDDRARNTLSPEDFNVVGQYTVTAETPKELFEDSLFVVDGQKQSQQVRDLNGDPFGPGSSLIGVALRFEPGAKESGGQVVLGAGQLRLLLEDRDGNTFGVHPIAVISQAKGDSLSFGRFRFDAKEIYAASVGAASQSTMVFEFPAPSGATPKHLMVKNIRIPMDSIPEIKPSDGAATFTTAARDEAINDQSLLKGATLVASADGADDSVGGGEFATRHSDNVVAGDDASALRSFGILVSSKLRDHAFSRGDRGSLEVNKENQIVRGEHTFPKGNTDIPPKLRVSEFLTSFDTTLVQIQVDTTGRFSILGKAMDAAQNVLPPILIGSDGRRYDAVGYIHKHSRGVTISYDRGNPIRGLSQIPQVTRSKPDDRLILLFLVSKGRNVEIESFQLGDVPIGTFDPPLRTAR